MFENDDIDLYVEQNNPKNPDEYRVGNQYHAYETYTVEIPVKDQESVHYTIRESLHGPIINDVVSQVKTDKPVAMYWVYTQRPNKMLEASYSMSRSNTITEFQKGPALIHAPGLNVMYGDAVGNVAWWASAKLYKRPNNAPTKLLLDGSNPENFKIDYRPFSENPQSVNPAWNYVYSCNNQPDSLVSKRYIPGYYLTHDRAKRVVQLLDTKNEWTQTETEEMVLDNTSVIATELIEILAKNIQEKEFTPIQKEALQKLVSWQGEASLKSIGTGIYTQFTYEYLKAIFEDELEKDIYRALTRTFFMDRMLEPLLKDKYPIWSDNILTKEVKETNADIQYFAFKKAVQVLESQLGDDVNTWTWDKLLSVEHKHPLGEIALFRPYFNVGPYPTSGTNHVLNNQIFTKNAEGKFEVFGGPSTRRIIDFSDVENAKAIIPTGNSGVFLSAHYKDQAQLYLEGKYIPMLIDTETIKNLDNKLVLKAD